MIEDSLNIYAMQDLDSLFNNVDYKALKESAKQHEELIEKLEKNKEMVANLRRIMDATDPNTKKVLDNISEIANEEAKQSLSELTEQSKKETKPKSTRGRKKKTEE